MSASVGIITFQWYDNFGTLFQAYALQEAITTLGFNAHIIPFSVRKNTGLRRFIAKTPIGTLQKIKKFIECKGLTYENGFELFRKTYFRRGRDFAIPFGEALKKVYDEDVLIFGSDNIWSVGSLPLSHSGFSVFFGDGIKHVNKIVYGASTAGYLQEHRFCSQIIERIRGGGFKRISCRERCTTDLLQEHGIDAVTVPDPTILMEQERWKEILVKPTDSGYVLGYDIGHEGQQNVADICLSIGKRYKCNARLLYPRRFIKYRKEAAYPDPHQWLGWMNDAGLVVTNSFHGVVFSIVFNNEFLYVPISGDSSALNMRAYELLKFLNLEDRILFPGFDPAIVAEKTKIDWISVNKKLVELRNMGLSYLREVLSCACKAVKEDVLC